MCEFEGGVEVRSFGGLGDEFFIKLHLNFT